MTANTRRERARESNRGRILDAALQVLESEGASALTIRRVAGDVEYTAPVVYQHFAGKEALLLALIVLGFEDLRADLERSAAQAPEAERFRLAARAYMDFAQRRPELYLLMNDGGVDSAERGRAAGAVIALTQGYLEAWASANGVGLGDAAAETNELVWGTLHGMASLGQIASIGHEHAAQLAERALDTLTFGWLRGALDQPAG
ncbi:MAG: TetR/AcrR family transcriptional regulator [Renibacterium sp.]|nr:TetR/AcrR family transcriptional regulator [Renibacterium sp.]